jgi:amino acid adenylation domain-containing protein
MGNSLKNPGIQSQRPRLSVSGSNGIHFEPHPGLRRPAEGGGNITTRSAETPSGPAALEKNSTYLLTSSQQRIWFFGELAPDVPLYNESESVRLAGELNAEAFEQALNSVVARHEVLRTTFENAEQGPIAIVHESWPLRIKLIDLSSLSPAQSAAELERLLIDEPRLPFRLETDPGIRATLVRLNPLEHVFILMMHHLVCDWASEGILWRELSSAYRSIVRGEPYTASNLPIQFGDYAVWQQQRVDGAKLARDLDFWKENLRGAPELQELPSDRPRPSEQTFRGARHRVRLDDGLTEALRNFSRREKTTLFTVFAAALNTLLYRYTGSEDVLLGIPVSDRRRPELQAVIGLLFDMQVLRTEFSAGITFLELLARMRKGLLALYRRREVPFDLIVNKVRPERSSSYSPLFQVMISWHDQDESLAAVGLEGLVVEAVRSETKTSKFDFSLVVTDHPDEIWLEAEYNTDLFDADRIARMFGHFHTLLEAAAADPARRLAELPLLTDVERAQLLDSTEVAYPREMCVHQLFEMQAGQTPDAVAAVFGEREVTYRELNERSNRLARHLIGLGVGPEVLVGICVERSIEMIVGLLGIMKAGGAYLPLDPSYPQERLAYMLRDSGASLILTQSSLRESLPGECNVICLDTDWPKIAEEESSDLKSNLNAENLAYVIYTSGSAGQPKGVEITHRSVVNLLCSMIRKPGLTAGDTLVGVTTLSFDIAALELFLPLCVGAKLVIASREVASNGTLLLEQLIESRATVIQATPITFRMLIEAGWNGQPAIKVLCGGEALSRELADQILARSNELWNMYGPTETTIWSAAVRVEPGDGPVPIGGPIDNTQFHVMDAGGQLAPIGVTGELHIGGDGLARGYFNRPELTAEKFISSTIDGDRPLRLYRTGDLVRRRADGAIEFLGRIDHQVKIRGFRIEPGEIEAVLKAHPGVGDCVVEAVEAEAGDKRLVAYVVPINKNSAPGVGELRDLLKEKLPAYMVPAAFVQLAEMPLTPNRKIDRKALPTPKLASEADYIAPRSPIEEVLAEIWCKLLGLDRVSIKDNFFDLGGTSILATRLGGEVQKSLNQRISVPVFLRSPTIQEMASVLEEAKHGELEDGRKSFHVVLRQGAKSLAVVPEDGGMVALQTAEGRPPFFIIDSFPYFIDVVKLLGIDQPVVSMIPRESAQRSPVYSVAEEAAVHVRAILECQPTGPYLLGGCSAAGIVAYEVAQQLRSCGHKVELLALFDAHNPHFVRAYSTLRTSLAFNRAAFRRKSWNEVPAWMATKLAKAVKTLGPQRDSVPDDEGQITDPTRRWPARSAAIKKYRPKPFAGRVLVFRRPTNLGGRYLDARMGWGEVVDAIEVVPLNGSRHLDLFKAESDRVLVAQKLRNCIDEIVSEPK